MRKYADFIVTHMYTILINRLQCQALCKVYMYKPNSGMY